MATDLDRPTCCGQPMLPIIYGLPGEDLLDASMRGEVALGGCCIFGDDPAFRCGECGRTSGRIDDMDEHMRDDEWE